MAASRIDLSGTWHLVDSENWDEYLKATGVNIVLRTAAKVAKPKVEISQNGDDFAIKTVGLLWNAEEHKFKIGVRFELENILGKFRAISNWEGNALKTTFTDVKNGKDYINIREIRQDGRMYLTIREPTGVSATRIFAKKP
ncbi:CRABP1 [Branchiostoma lanceolatum]|uniref:CRABP1 protein n=1 Tax=Branchiostoma lanceolatum TaxID=7740 RepID=A0A8J9W503_BRALA|nr:CRABP1 [Branchiostoma lanceolatum]